MSEHTPTFSSVHASARLADTPLVKCRSDWWLVTPSGSLRATDPHFIGELDGFAAALALADQAVAEAVTGQRAGQKAER
ncbi:hypothetical protein [Streptomyces silvisoli]|uniref:DUF2188 domain-containing protein n=1 Tax=Streptomyces silvisoli TaxID=3034235 RepID=A0ABT5ZPY3_9ACTN|nr:hypothetical protein [Streptomyces silvisoli]MDF3291890.1 hypothetical protein [Streptomyces silvisoli]